MAMAVPAVAAAAVPVVRPVLSVAAVVLPAVAELAVPAPAVVQAALAVMRS